MSLAVKSQDSFSERIRRARLYAGFSQRRLALALGCDIKTIGRWENGRTVKPDARLFHEFATLTRSDIAWLYEGGARDAGKDDRNP